MSQFIPDITWIVTSAILIFFMQIGFLCLESGMTRAKNNINVAAKNLVDFLIALIVFSSVGFGIMYGDTLGGWFGSSGYFLESLNSPFLLAFFFYQSMFCTTSVTIISGAVAERINFSSYMVITLIVCLFVYPLFGHWAWNGIDTREVQGWLGAAGFIDFAGSTVVHSVGGWAALAAILVIGPRNGRFAANGSPREIQGENIPLALVGVMLLWVGWFGFNGGSLLEFDARVILIIINTLLAGVFGGVTTVAISYLMFGMPKIAKMINGPLAGLVAITACADSVSPMHACIIGSIAGIVMMLVTRLLEQYRIDDVVGAVPVHLGAGIWGTLAVALFADIEILATGLTRTEQLFVQLQGIVVCCALAFGAVFIFLKFIDRHFPLRVSDEAEELGLNVSEHGASNAFQHLVQGLHKQEHVHDLNLRVHEEPFTEAGIIACRYNKVMDSLQGAMDDLVESEKQNSLGALVAGVAHELNTPLGLSITVTSCLKEATDDFSLQAHKGNIRRSDLFNYLKRASESHDILIGNVNRAAELVSSFKMVAVDQADKDAKPRTINLKEYLDGILLMLKPELRRTPHNIMLDIPKDLLITCDPGALSQIVTNLVMNSLIHGFEHKAEGTIRLSALKDNENVEIHYKDDGKGLSETQLRMLYDPFFTTKRDHGGSGLGMSIVFKLVTQTLGGRIQCNSSEGEGICITLTIPVSPPAASYENDIH